jgi:hypothetical protein
LKKLAVLVSLFLFFSCGNSESIKISKQEYNELKNLPPERVLILGKQVGCKIITASDNHEYYSQEVGMAGYATGDIYLHYINCEFCAKTIKTERK